MMSLITVREVIVDALGANGRVVVLSANLLSDDLLKDNLLKDNLLMDNLSTACETVGGSLIQPGNRRFAPTAMSVALPRRRAALLRITAALLATTSWVSETQATPETRHPQADGFAICAQAAAARNVVLGVVPGIVPGVVLGRAAGDLDIERVQVSRFGGGSVRLAQAAVDGTKNLQKALEQQRDQLKADDSGAECKSFKDDRAARLEQDLAAALRAVETQTALAAKANDEVVRLRQEAENGAGELQSFLQQERARAGRLEQDLAAARRGVDTQTALAAKASYEAERLKRALESGAGELQESLKQERGRADRLEQDLAAAHHEVETQTALAAKASNESAQSKQAAESGGSDLQKSLQQEHVRADRLEQDLAAARREVETQTALAAKVSAEAAQSKQVAESGGSDPQKSLKQERARADRLEQDLAAARRDVETKTALVLKASDIAARAKQAAESSVGDLQKSLQKEHARADRLEQDVAAARRNAETQMALATKASAEAAQAKQAAESGSSDLQKSLQQERDRADRLEQDLAAARRDVETKTVLVMKASAAAARAKQAAESGSGDLQKSLQQEHDRADKLEQDLAAVRREAETKSALATKASAEAAQVKQAAEAGVGDLQKSLQQEHDRADRLERDLTVARRDVETMSVLVIKVSAAAARAKQAAASSAADLQKSLQQEHVRAGQLEQDLAAARRDVETKAVLMMKASAAAARARRAAEGGAGELQKSLQQERDRADRLAQDLAAARRDVETQTALATKASDEAARAKQAAQSGAGDLQKSLQQERERADRLAQDLTAARRDIETKAALVIKASDAAARAKQAAESGAGELQKSLQQEHDRAGRLAQDLAAARRDVETQAALATKASDEAARARQAAQSGAGDLQKSLQQERERADQLERDLAAARRDVETRTALVLKASAIAAQAKQAAESGAGEFQKSLQQEHDRAGRLEQDLAAARRDAESKTALAAKAGDEVARVKQAAERIVGELQRSLQQERDQRARLEKNLASAEHAKDAPATPEADTAAHTVQDVPDTRAKPGPDQMVVADARAELQLGAADAAEAAGLLVRARALLGQGNIGAARTVLERAVERGSAQASFELAETYDPLILPRWGTYGTRADVTKARDLYAKAEAGGIKEAKERSDALQSAAQ